MKKNEIYVHGIVKDYENNIEKYLFSENERLNSIIDQYEEIIDDAIDFCQRYHSLNLEDFDTYKLLEKLLEILEGENEKD